MASRERGSVLCICGRGRLSFLSPFRVMVKFLNNPLWNASMCFSQTFLVFQSGREKIRHQSCRALWGWKGQPMSVFLGKKINYWMSPMHKGRCWGLKTVQMYKEVLWFHFQVFSFQGTERWNLFQQDRSWGKWQESSHQKSTLHWWQKQNFFASVRMRLCTVRTWVLWAYSTLSNFSLDTRQKDTKLMKRW